ncbi:MAG: tRNA (adenosine(37)-N6)-dimethylallyltransferase MiaA [Candidatus Nanosyncoccaceae bacterium]|jgi:tRNA dimethylallyltransferase
MAASKSTSKPLVVIVGPTASGKTGLSIRLAKRLNGEIISADSRAVYRYLDIGTAKPSLAEREGVPHWGIDLVEPNEKYSVADFQRYAKAKIKDIRRRGRVPFLVGGTGLYIDSIIFDYKLVNGLDYDLERQKYEHLSLEELWSYCNNNNISLPNNWKNRRYVINQIIRAGKTHSRRHSIVDNCFVFGIDTDRDVLKQRVSERAEKMFAAGVIKEAEWCGQKYGWENESMTSNIYPILRRYINGEIELSQAIELFKNSDWRLVKKQLTWFKRNPFIDWVSLDSAEEKIIQKVSSVLI